MAMAMGMALSKLSCRAAGLLLHGAFLPDGIAARVPSLWMATRFDNVFFPPLVASSLSLHLFSVPKNRSPAITCCNFSACSTEGDFAFERALPLEGEAAQVWVRKKHLCYYFSQGLCTLMEDALHLAKFSHSYPVLKVSPKDLVKAQQQPFKYFLVLDLEGRVEILEFPVVMINADTLEVVDRFHRFVRPVLMSKARIEEYVGGKYGQWGLDRVWLDTAIPFGQVLELFEGWLEGHGLWNKTCPEKLNQAAFVTCGNWDVKTKIPEQCTVSGIDLPPYFMEWINLKDIYLNFYKKRAGGMLAMLKGLNIRLRGTHHVGLDDAHNIAHVLQHMIADGAIIKITAKRKPDNPKDVMFMFKYRVK
eukprot:c20247_g1_i1 orf=126-1211(+)